MNELFFLLLQAEPAVAAVAIDVDLSTLAPGEPTSAVESDYIAIYSGVARILRAGGVPIAAPESDLDTQILDAAAIPTVARDAVSSTLTLEFSSPDIAQGIYRIHISAQSSEGASQALPPLTCGPSCPPEDVEAFLQERSSSVFALLDAPAPTAAPTASVVGPSPAPPAPTHSSLDARPLGPVGIAGIVFGGLGLGGFVWGTTNYALDRSPDRLHDLEQVQHERHFDPATSAVWGAGAALLVAGTVMLVLDQVVLKKERMRRDRPLSSRALPTLSFSF